MDLDIQDIFADRFSFLPLQSFVCNDSCIPEWRHRCMYHASHTQSGPQLVKSSHYVTIYWGYALFFYKTQFIDNIPEIPDSCANQ